MDHNDAESRLGLETRGPGDARAVGTVEKLTAENIIEKHVIVAMAAALIPLPSVFDMAAVIAIEVNMIAALARSYSFPVPHKLVLWKIVIAVVGALGPAYLSYRFADLIKGLPIFGQVVYISVLSISGGASVYAVGKLFQEHFESGGTFLSSENAVLRKYYTTKHKEGLKLVPVMMRRAQPATGVNIGA